MSAAGRISTEIGDLQRFFTGSGRALYRRQAGLVGPQPSKEQSDGSHT